MLINQFTNDMMGSCHWWIAVRCVLLRKMVTMLRYNVSYLYCKEIQEFYRKTWVSIWINPHSKSSDRVSQFKCLRRTVTDQNEIHDDIRRKISSINVCYYMVLKLLESCVFSSTLKMIWKQWSGKRSKWAI